MCWGNKVRIERGESIRTKWVKKGYNVGYCSSWFQVRRVLVKGDCDLRGDIWRNWMVGEKGDCGAECYLQELVLKCGVCNCRIIRPCTIRNNSAINYNSVKHFI